MAAAAHAGGTRPGGDGRRNGSGSGDETEQRPDFRLIPAAAAGWGSAALGLVLPAAGAVIVAVGAGVAATGCAVLAWRGHRRRVWPTVAAAALLVAAAATAVAALRAAPLRSGPLPELAARSASAEVELVVTGDPQRHEPKVKGMRRSEVLVVVPARAEVVTARGVRLELRVPITVLTSEEAWLPLLPGQRARASGRLATPRPGDAVAATISVHGGPTLLGDPGLLQRVAGVLRAGLRDAADGLAPAERGLLPGLVVGDTSRLPSETEDDFKEAGLTHLTAVSGANVAIVVGAVLFVAVRVGVRGRWLPLLGTLALLGFVVLARPQPSVLRAAAMGLVTLAALATGRRRRGVPALAAAVIVLLLLDPWQARSFGFALSVLATGALLVLAPPLVTALHRRRLPLVVAQALAVPLAASALTAPVIVLLSSSVSLVSVVANLLVAPAVAPATVLGVLAAVVAPVSPAAAAGCAHVAAVPLWWIVQVAAVSAGLPAATVPWPAGWGGAALLAAVLGAGALLGPALWRVRPMRVAALAGLMTLLLQPAVNPRWPPPGWLLVACDVGQGDALVLDGGPGGAVVVDAGPDPEAADRCLTDLGVERVALVVLTHFHADHVEGLPGVLRGRSVAALEVSPLEEPPGEADRVAAWAADAGIVPLPVGTGDQRSAGKLRWQVVAPARTYAGENANDASVVLLFEARGLRMLLTGDVEPAGQAALRDAAPGVVDVLKVPHHGSAHQDFAFLESLHARAALVSAGVDNDYGHPAMTTLAALQRQGVEIGRTDTDGDVAVVTTGEGELALVRRGPGRRER
ncbi:DUF4131 domain-containing protein [Motilibacter sp. E257]|uniref:DUF4131 domain-containing protein n=1 Tax=Motilibacter deserti TaxID=2714956 RepID=A0ABX0GTI3_9ACTN|nr:DUF4131 domain-containing protein [Motilibacter deserti]